MMVLDDKKLKQSYELCQKIMKKKAVNFYHAFKYMSSDDFKAICGVYAFCRYVDDIVDENEEESKESKVLKLDTIEYLVYKLHEDIHLHEDFSKDNLWYYAFYDSVLKYDIPITALSDQIKGQRQDLTFNGIVSIDDLNYYSSLVAGSVGRMLMPMLTTTNNEMITGVCNDLGVAMQITNILRDIGEDYKTRDRIYLPQDLMKQMDVTKHDIESYVQLKKTKIDDTMVDLWESLAKQAEEKYNNFINSIMLFKPEVRLPLILACENYRAILEAVRLENHNCFTKRCYTSNMKRIEIFQNSKAILKDIEMR